MQPPRFEFYDQESPIYTSPRFLPPAKVVKSKINDAIISHGSYLEECTVSNAIVGLRSRIDKHAVIQVLSLPARTTSTCSIVGRAPFDWNQTTLQTGTVVHAHRLVACQPGNRYKLSMQSYRYARKYEMQIGCPEAQSSFQGLPLHLI